VSNYQSANRRDGAAHTTTAAPVHVKQYIGPPPLTTPARLLAVAVRPLENRLYDQRLPLLPVYIAPPVLLHALVAICATLLAAATIAPPHACSAMSLALLSSQSLPESPPARARCHS
jgi:hypothetical protein